MPTRRILQALALALIATSLAACKQPQPAAPVDAPAADAPATGAPAPGTAAPASEATAAPKLPEHPTLKLATVDGGEYDLAARRGKWVVVNFWATWCEPCREEMPSLERLKGRLAGKSFEVVAVNVGESPERVARFTREVPVTFPIVYDRDSSAAKSWKVRGYPTSYVVGPDGRIRYYFVGELDWSSDEVVRAIEGVR